MPIPPFRRPGRGRPPASDTTSRLMGDVEDLAQTTGTGEIGFGDVGGQQQVLDGRPDRPWIRITAHTTGNAYAFIRVFDGDSAFPDLVGTSEQGDGISVIAREVNGRADVPVGAKVHASRNQQGLGYTFAYDGPGDGTVPTGSCAIAVLKPTDCIRITNSFDGSIHYGTNTGAGVWTSDDDLDYPLGSGSLVYSYVAATGVETLTLDGIKLKPCGNGCWSGGPLTGHASTVEGEPCDGETFTVCLSCSCCPIDGWAGPGWYCVGDPCVPVELLEEDKCDTDIVICSGPYATQELAEVDCGPVLVACLCPSNPIPRTLYLRFKNASGGCACAVGVAIPIYYNGTGWYTGVPESFPWPCDPSFYMEVRFEPGGGCMLLTVIIHNPVGPVQVNCLLSASVGAAQVNTCSPFKATLVGASMGSCCLGTVDLEISTVA